MGTKREVFSEPIPGVKVRIRYPGPAFVGGDTKYFYHRIVKENIREFYADPKDERKGLNACVLLYHMLDWHCKTQEEKEALYSKIPFGEVLESVVNGAKHSNPDKKYKTYIDSEHRLMAFEKEQDIELLDVIKETESFWDKIYDEYYIGVYNETTDKFE